MKGRRQAGLDEDERILWHGVARTVLPLKGRSVPGEDDTTAASNQPGNKPPERRSGGAAAQPAARHATPLRKPSGKPVLDRPTRTKIARGRLAIDASLDLHGLTQAEAHDLLLSFLRRAAAAGKRHVLVVTGKGSASRGDGVLRRAVPGWLATAAFAGLVSGFDEAAQHHGGGGALYIRLRKAGPS